MKTTTILFKDPSDLGIHPEAKKLPALAKDDERFIALVEDIRTRGIDQPLQIDTEDRVLEGKDRLNAAKQLQLKEVPVIVRAREDALAVIVHSIVQRKHYTKGALAYVVFPLMAGAHREAQARRLEMLKKGNKSPSSTESTTGKSIEQFASELGFRRDLFFQARELHKLFTASDEALEQFDLDHPDGGSGRPDDLRAEFEPKLLAGEIGLGATIAGIAGKVSTKGQAKPESEQLMLFEEAWETLQIRASRDWSKFDEFTKRKLGQKIKDTLLQLPEEIIEVVAKAIRERSRERGPKS